MSRTQDCTHARTWSLPRGVDGELLLLQILDQQLDLDGRARERLELRRDLLQLRLGQRRLAASAQRLVVLDLTAQHDVARHSGFDSLR